MGKLGKIVGTAVLVGGVAFTMYSAGKKIIDFVSDRDAYFSGLPEESVKAKDNSAWAMWHRVTEGVSNDKRPTPNEFYGHICKMNNISRFDLESRFPVKDNYTLPDYDGKPNN